MKRYKTIPLIFFFSLPFILLNCESKDSPGFFDESHYDFEKLSKAFLDPPVDYSTAPFWVWNDEVTIEKIDAQLPMFKEQGIYQVFIHPRPGLITEYLSAEWFELCKYAVTKGKELGMKIWLYDENSYPSGFAGGHLISAMPPSFDPVVGLKLNRLKTIQASDTDKYYIVIKKINSNFANISGGVSRYVDQPGEYYAFTKWYYPENEAWFGGFSYVDLLAYGITERFIKITMDGYEEYLGEDLGNSVPGIFTDEPNINTRGDDTDVIRFTPVLFNKFMEKYGYQLENYLPCLYDEVGDWKNVRHDYYSLLLDMFIERWAVPWYDYTEENNLIWTGHYWEHGWPNPKHGGDNMAMYAWHQYPGVDMLFNSEEIRPDQFGNVRAVKELSSVVNQLGKKRALSETYGGAGWELSFEDMKRLGDWEYALGVNFMNQHLSHMTIKGARKRDYPQSMSYHTPWWEDYKVLNEYYARLSLALSLGRQINRILILEPTTSSWMYFSPSQDRRHLGAEGIISKYKDSFHGLLNTLETHQIEYDLGSERIIKDHGIVRSGRFGIGEREYDLVVLPPHFENFESYVFDLITSYLAQGGKVLSLAGIPERLDGNVSGQTKTFIEKYPELWIEADSLNQEILEQHFLDPGFQPVRPENWRGRIFHQRRKYSEGQLLFMVNFDPDDEGNFNLKIEGKTALVLDPFTGKYKKFPHISEEDKLVITGILPPAGSLLLFISDKNVKADELPVTNPAKEINTEASAVEIHRNDKNMLTLDYCNLDLAGITYHDMYFYNAEEKIFEHHLKEIYGFNYNPWSNGVQYRKRILEKNKFGKGSGFKAHFPFQIKGDFLPSQLRLVVEWPQLYKVSCNQQVIQPLQDEWWLDHSFGVFDISGYLKPGENTITLEAEPMDIHAELEPVYLTGDFGLAPAEKGWIITEPEKLELGSWRTQGMPFYSGSVSYTKKFSVEENGLNHKVKLNDWSGTVAEVYVNDAKVGIIGWKPYEMDITGKLKTGENIIEIVVVGSLKNLLGPHHNNPRPGVVTPWSFFYAPESQPRGTDYHQLDYGMLEDFGIWSF